MNEWKDFEKEKPQDAELVLVYGREKYTKCCYGHSLATYNAEDDLWSCDKPYQNGISVKYWMRIPDIP